MTTSTQVPETVNLESLRAGDVIDVETQSRRYHIECLGGSAVRISGHPVYCPTPVAAQIEGAVDRHNELESGRLGRGKRMMFFLEDHRPITTSKIVSMHVN